MKVKYIIRLLPLFAAFLLLNSCRDEETPSQNALINNWIKGNMDYVYYWNKEMASVRANKNSAPEDYFRQLLYPDDRFSWITDDAQELRNEMSGHSYSMGYSPAFGRKQASGQYFIIVEFVYENSPAAKAGLKRGDLIAAINDQDITPSNFGQLYSQSSYSVTLGTNTESRIERTNIKLNLTAENVAMDPVLHSDVIEYNGIKTGYLAYAEFISGEDGEWLTELRSALNEIRQAGATELILDLRYNPGGEIAVAGELASMIAPGAISNNHEVLIRIEYNDRLQNAIEKEEGPESENLIYKFPSTSVNLDLDRVVILTSAGTASASELLITGLRPYMNVIQIGEPTVGKFYGAIIIDDEENPPAHTYAIVPLILKYKNAQGLTDFTDGLAPDILVADDLLNAKPLGDIEDPVIATALSVLTGAEELARVKPTGLTYKKLPDEQRLRRGSIMKR